MNVNDDFNKVAIAKKEFSEWIINKPFNFKCLQFIFPFTETDKEITTWIFFQKNKDVVKHKKTNTLNLIINKFKVLLLNQGLSEETVNTMKFEVDSDENVKNNYEGNYFYRLR